MPEVDFKAAWKEDLPDGISWLNMIDNAHIDQIIDSIDFGPVDDVPPVKELVGGHTDARRYLDVFLGQKLASYDAQRNLPGSDYQSYMSAYLHYGHISPVEICLAVNRATKASKINRDAYLEEVLVRRELAINFVWYNSEHYDSLQCLPDWTLKTIAVSCDFFIYVE